MINEIKKDLRAQIDIIQDRGYPMDKAIWGEEGVLLSGDDALALLDYIEYLEKESDRSDRFLEEISEAMTKVKSSWIQQATRGKRPDKEPLTEEKLTKFIDQLEPGGDRLTFKI